ncbi:MAG: hypothetical protein O7G87_02770 [bacterium]|nr:hypothetical protein [bacterium]
MLPTLLITGALLLVLLYKVFAPTVERCPDCSQKREDDTPICDCGWVFEYPEDDTPLEYGDPDEHPD